MGLKKGNFQEIFLEFIQEQREFNKNQLKVITGLDSIEDRLDVIEFTNNLKIVLNHKTKK